MFTVYVPLIVCGPGFAQLSRHSVLNVHVPELLGVPEMVAPVFVQFKLNPWHEVGVHCVFVYGGCPPETVID